MAIRRINLKLKGVQRRRHTAAENRIFRSGYIAQTGMATASSVETRTASGKHALQGCPIFFIKLRQVALTDLDGEMETAVIVNTFTLDGAQLKQRRA